MLRAVIKHCSNSFEHTTNFSLKMVQ